MKWAFSVFLEGFSLMLGVATVAFVVAAVALIGHAIYEHLGAIVFNSLIFVFLAFVLGLVSRWIRRTLR